MCPLTGSSDNHGSSLQK
ncbi:mCG140740 [Mus musculus]|nr:mCG140740 [Mus musculus]